jgi:hypothetical protein
LGDNPVLLFIDERITPGVYSHPNCLAIKCNDANTV